MTAFISFSLSMVFALPDAEAVRQRPKGEGSAILATAPVVLARASAPAPKANVVPKIEDLENRILEQRRLIKSGHFVINSGKWSGTNEKDKTLRAVHEHEIWLDDAQECIRWEMRQPADVTDVRRQQILKTKNLALAFTIGSPKAMIPQAIMVHDTKETVQKFNNRDLKRVPRPVLIGMVTFTWANTGQTTLDEIVGRADRDNVEVAADRFQDTDCLRVSFELRKELKCRYWADPSRGFTVRRIEYEVGSTRLSVETSYEKSAGSGIWFPKRSSLISHEGDVVRNEEGLEVKLAEPNAAIKAAVFTVEDLPLPPGTELIYSDKRTKR